MGAFGFFLANDETTDDSEDEEDVSSGALSITACIGLSKEEHAVERVVGKHVNNAMVAYEVKWLGYPAEDNTFEPLESMRNALRSVAMFEQSEAIQGSNSNIVVQGGGISRLGLPGPVKELLAVAVCRDEVKFVVLRTDGYVTVLSHEALVVSTI